MWANLRAFAILSRTTTRAPYRLGERRRTGELESDDGGQHVTGPAHLAGDTDIFENRRAPVVVEDVDRAIGQMASLEEDGTRPQFAERAGGAIHPGDVVDYDLAPE